MKILLKRAQAYTLYFILAFIFLGGYYFTVLHLFNRMPVKYNDNLSNFEKFDRPSSTLVKRLGTVLWHSGNIEGGIKTYCYYPGGGIEYNGKRGEYIIKEAHSFSDCQGWHGIIEAKEGSWLSETVKFFLPRS